MTYRFEEEDYIYTYILEDYYHTNPIFDYNYVVVFMRNQDKPAKSFAFQVNFNKTFNTIPDHPKLTEVQTKIAKEFAKNAADELILLFKQRAIEAKAYGEKTLQLTWNLNLVAISTFLNYFQETRKCWILIMAAINILQRTHTILIREMIIDACSYPFLSFS